MVRRVHHPGAHSRRCPDHAVEARVPDHLDDRRHAPAGFAEHLRPRAAQFDLGGRVRMVAQLVLQALDVKCVAASIRKDPRQ